MVMVNMVYYQTMLDALVGTVRDGRRWRETEHKEWGRWEVTVKTWGGFLLNIGSHLCVLVSVTNAASLELPIISISVTHPSGSASVFPLSIAGMFSSKTSFDLCDWVTGMYPALFSFYLCRCVYVYLYTCVCVCVLWGISKGVRGRSCTCEDQLNYWASLHFCLYLSIYSLFLLLIRRNEHRW